MGGWFDDVYRDGADELLGCLDDPGLDHLGRQGARHEDHPAVGPPTDPVAAGGHPVDPDSDGGVGNGGLGNLALAGSFRRAAGRRWSTYVRHA